MATQQQLIDDLLAQHPPGAVGGPGIPGYGETAARFFINDALAVFCEQARLWRDYQTLTTAAGTTTYALDAETSEVLRVTIPALSEYRVIPRLIDPIESVTATFSAGTSAPPVYFIRPDGTAPNDATTGGYQLHLGRLGEGALTALDAGLTVEVKRIARPAALTDSTFLYDADGNIVEDADGNAVTVVADEVNDVLGLPVAFHQAPVYYASAALYMKRRDLPMPERIAMKRELMRDYERLVRMARAYGERGLERGVNPRPVYF